MLLEAELAEGAQRVDGANPFGRLIGEKGDGDRDQAADEMRVAVAPVMEDRLARSVRSLLRAPATPG